MKIQLHSIDHAPRQLPYWQTLMDDLCQPSPQEVAKVLGLSERTVYRYNATGSAPRVVSLALFWLTRWGRNAVHTQAHNDAVMLAGYVGGLRSQVAQLEAQVQQLRQIGHATEAIESARPTFTRRLRHVRAR